jgi:hypothetical protein
VAEGPDRHEQREGRDREEADVHAVPARLARDAHEEVRARDVARAHQQRRQRRLDVPGEVVARVVGEEVQRHERDEQERDDEDRERPRAPEDPIVAHGLFYTRPTWRVNAHRPS